MAGDQARFDCRQAMTAVVAAIAAATRMIARAWLRCDGLVNPPVPSSMVLMAAANIAVAHNSNTIRTRLPQPVAGSSENNIAVPYSPALGSMN